VLSRLTVSMARLSFGRGSIPHQSSHFYSSNVYVVIAVRVCESTGRFRLELAAGEPLLETYNSCGYSRAARHALVATLGRFTHMTKSTQSNPPKFRFSNIFWTGLVLLTVGSGPLLAIILFAALGITKDPNPNPIGFGILAFLTFLPSVGLILGGSLVSVSRYRAARKHFHDHAA